MNHFIYIILYIGLSICNTTTVIAQTDTINKNIDSHQKYLDMIAKIPYPKLNKKELKQFIERYLVIPIKNANEKIEFGNFSCKYHNLNHKKRLKLNKANNILLGTLFLKKENGETLTFEFKILIHVFLVFGNHYEWKISRIYVKNNEENEWLRLNHFLQQF